jgi:hypothetical protein
MPIWGCGHETASEDIEEITRALKVLFYPGAVVEMRIPKTERDGTVSGYFDNHESLGKQLATRNGNASIYVTMNPVLPALLARAANRVKARAHNNKRPRRGTTGDGCSSTATRCGPPRFHRAMSNTKPRSSGRAISG